MQLQIRHIEKANEKSQFEIVNMHIGKHSEAVCLTPPDEIMVEPHNIILRQGLQWYLEEYLELPIDTFKKKAESIQGALRQWGKDTFRTLFGSGLARDWYQDSRKEEPAVLEIKIVSDNPAILAWPWEALESETDGLLALKYTIERQLCNIADPRSQNDNLPKDRLNILYIIARPYGEDDVGFQALARPLVDFAFAGNEIWPVHIDLLRPPTFDRLREILDEKPGFYHIVHFDGHGVYGYQDSHNRTNAMNDRFAGPEGSLVFERETVNGGEPISAEMLGELLSGHNIPAMVLNACQSAMVDERAETPFASVAPSLLKAGIYSVVAMSYSLWVSGAKEFLSGFYQQLFKDGSIAEAVQTGRKEMYRNNMRDSFTGKVKFNDWIVPVLYQQMPYGYSSLPGLKPGTERNSILPEEASELINYGFIGRDGDILRLEQAIQRQAQAGILVHGMSGEGKTTLAQGFLRWLEETNGLGSGAFWFGFEDIHSADHIIDKLADRLFGTRALSLPLDEKISALVKRLKAERFFLVWDNFESASGIPGTDVTGLIAEEGRQTLKRFLHELRGGRTKVLITSRSTEDWLTLQECFRLPLEGLRGEELWQYCNAVVADLGLTLDREDKSCQDLLNKLDGNPLALRAVLLRLRERDAATLLAELEESFNGLQGDEATKRIQAALSVFERGLDRAFAPVLRLLGLHEHYAGEVLIGDMLNDIKSEAEPHIINNCFAALESAGLCFRPDNILCKLHPSLHSCLARQYPAEETDRRVFADYMASLINSYTPREAHELRALFSLFGANFRRAIGIARELDMREAEMYLTMKLADNAWKTRNFKDGELLFTELLRAAQNYGDFKMEAAAYHQLGLMAQEQRDFAAAEGWYKKALKIVQRLNDEYYAAGTYHQLGIMAHEQRDFAEAEDWYKKALEIAQRLGDEYNLAGTYHQLGSMALDQHDFTAAEDWYKKALEIDQRLGNENHIANTYHQLGIMAHKQRDFAAAEGWYKRALEIKQRLGDEHRSASTYHQLGLMAHEQRDFAAAEDWFKEALKIAQRLNDEYYAAGAYHQLGAIAQEQRDFAAAEDWYKKALEIKQRLGDEYGTANTYHELGIMAQEQRDFAAAEDWYKKALEIKQRLGEEYFLASTYHQLGSIAKEHRVNDQ